MTETIRYHLVSLGPLPLWLGGLALAAALAWTLWHLHVELGRRTPSARPWSVYVTRALVALLLGLLLLQPALFIVRERHRPAPVVVLADRSRSMLRADAYDATRLLDIAQATGEAEAPGRETLPLAIARYLRGNRSPLDEARRELQAMHDQLAQGLPWGEAFAATFGQTRTFLQKTETALRDFAVRLAELEARLRRANEPPADENASPSAAPPFDPVPFQAMDALLAAAARTKAPLDAIAGGTHTAEALDALLREIGELREDWSRALPAFTALQAASDDAAWKTLPEATRERIDAIRSWSRFDLARRFVRRLEKTPAIAAGHAIRLVGWEDLSPDDAAPETDLYAPLEDAASETVHETIAGIVLVSDGGQNLPPSPGVLRRLRGRGIPFLAAGVGRAEALADVALVDYRLGRILEARKDAVLHVRLKTAVAKGTPIDIELLAGKESLLRRRVQADGSPRLSASFEVRVPRETGSALWTLRARTESPDAVPDNDETTFAVHILRRDARALVLARAPRWDVTYLLRALERTPCRVDTVFWGEVKEGRALERGRGRGKVPDELSQLRSYELLVIEGPAFPGMTEKDPALLAAYVREAGGALLLLADGKGESLADTLAWLPAATESAAADEEAAGTIEPAPDARFLPALRLAADGAESLGRWRSLTPPTQARPVAPQQLPMLTRETAPLLSLGFYGRGRVYLLGVGDLFRLREWDGGAAVSRFLTALVEDTLFPVFEDNKAATGIYPVPPVAGMPFFLLHAGEGEAPITLRADGGPGRTIDAPFDKEAGLRIGRAEIGTPGALTVSPAEGGPLATAAVRPISSETIHVRLDEAFLQRLAREADGAYTPLSDLPDAIASLPARTARDITFREIRLWNHPLLLLLLPALLILDWVLRRRAGLVL